MTMKRKGTYLIIYEVRCVLDRHAGPNPPLRVYRLLNTIKNNEINWVIINKGKSKIMIKTICY